jgi:aminopeptidase N
MKKLLSILIIIVGLQNIYSQNFTRKDSLQGGLRPERTSYDVLRYDLNIKVNIDEKFISGYNDVSFKVISDTKKIQLDLFENMKVDSIIYNSKRLDYKRDFNAVFINFTNDLKAGNSEKIRFYYSGKPLIAKNAPWDGGFVFKKDKAGKPWIGVAVQGTGASLWYPVKDSQSDEPDNGASIKVAVPNGVMNVSNGKFLGSEDLKNGYTRWDWEVKSPINTYDITLNIADYAHIHDSMNDLSLDYYVLKENEEKARKQFEQVKPMITCFESKFGKYPFTQDGYKLVETPYLGMEHQSAVAYGNKYKNGYLGNDLSQTGVGLLFDYILIHESGHEWFGNSITSKDIADMWIHESFTQYTEVAYIDCLYGAQKAKLYVNGLRGNVRNDKPIIGNYGVNSEGSGDMYPKGALLLNTIKNIVNDDTKWWKMLLKYSETYRHKIIDTETVVNFFNTESGINLTPVFNQYLRYPAIPELVIKKNKKNFEYRWKTMEPNFNMPVDIVINKKEMRLYPSNVFQKSKVKIKDLNEVDVLTDEFFIDVDKQ